MHRFNLILRNATARNSTFSSQITAHSKRLTSPHHLQAPSSSAYFQHSSINPKTPSVISLVPRRWQSNQHWNRYRSQRPIIYRPSQGNDDQRQGHESYQQQRQSKLGALTQDPTFRWIALGGTGSAIIFYYMHLEEAPVSGRKRFMISSEDSVEQEGTIMYQRIMDEATRAHALLPSWDQRVVMVRRVMDRLIVAGNLEHVNFEVHVLQSPEKNAFVLPGGKVFVFTGILDIAKDDNGLASILGHEIAHNTIRHAAERMSGAILLAPLRWTLILLDLTGYTFGLGRLFGDFGLGLAVEMPASRQQESEADYVGMMMMAKACYDPNAAVSVWSRMQAAESASNAATPQWLSTHPSNATRIQQMQTWLPEAEKVRAGSGCAVTNDRSRAFAQFMRGF